MCGRFTQKRSVIDYASIFEARASDIDWSPRYNNLSPGQQARTVRMLDPGSKPEIATLLWGLIPHWFKEKGKYSTVNARNETVDTNMRLFPHPFVGDGGDVPSGITLIGKIKHSIFLHIEKPFI
ncbi:MAG: SOS response-associated peptidase family protein [Leptospirales bacterium]